MPKYLVLLFSLICTGFSVRSQESIFDDFSTNAKFTDFTKKLIWSDSEVTMSGFQLNTAIDLGGISKKCLSLTPEAMEKTGYKPGSIKASQAIDYVLTEILNRNQNIYK